MVAAVELCCSLLSWRSSFAVRLMKHEAVNAHAVYLYVSLTAAAQAARVEQRQAALVAWRTARRGLALSAAATSAARAGA